MFVCRSSSSFLPRKYECVELVSPCGTNYCIQAQNKMFSDEKHSKNKVRDNIQKTQTQKLQQYFGLSQRKHNRIFLVSSSHIRTKWCGIRMQWTEKITVKMVLEKSKVFSLGKCIKCHLQKQKYHVCLLQFLQLSPQKIRICSAGVSMWNQLLYASSK